MSEGIRKESIPLRTSCVYSAAESCDERDLPKPRVQSGLTGRIWKIEISNTEDKHYHSLEKGESNG